jgi:glycosyltransferase involved in cell wall biosynthesis
MLVHEWLEASAGSEKTFEAMARAAPGAVLAALTFDPEAAIELGGRFPAQTVLSRAPEFVRSRRDVLLPAMPIAWSLLGRNLQADVLVTSSHAFAKHIARTVKPSVHLNYCYSPMRYAWLGDYRDRGTALTRAGAVLAGSTLRRIDLADSRTVTEFCAISATVRDRIHRFYDRDAKVIYPPVDTAFYTRSRERAKDVRLLAVSRFVPYKQLDLAIRVAKELDLEITIAGSGPCEGELRHLAKEIGARVQWIIAPNNEQLRDLYSSAHLLIFPAEEDFGIVPVEAQACGTPVVAYSHGGSSETVLDGITGVLSSEQTVEGFTLATSAALNSDLVERRLRAHASTFSEDTFVRHFADWLASYV